MESFEVQGHWWLPNQTEPIAGTLRFSPSDGVTLDLMGGFGDPIREAFSGERHTAIHGIDVEGNRYTVFFPLLSRSKIRSGGMVTTAYSSHFVLRGEHYASKDDVRIRKVRCRFWSLDEWVDTSGIQIETTSHSPPEFTIQYSMPKKITINISPHLILSIEFSAHGPAQRVAQTSVSFEQKAWVGLEAVDDSFDLDKALGLVGHLQDFLTLGMGEPTYVLECEAVLDDVTDEKGRPVKGALFWKQPFRREQRKNLLPLNMFFTWRDLGDNVREHLEKWYEYRESLQKFFPLLRCAIQPWFVYRKPVFNLRASP